MPASEPVSDSRLDSKPRTGQIIAVSFALAVGSAVRLASVLPADFPLGDGGLFYAMVRDLQASHWTLPFLTSYNSAGIPFAYPPLSFYLAALVQNVTSWPLSSVFLYLPVVFNIAALLAFVRLSRRVLHQSWAAVAAVFAFVLLPSGFEWLIMGGGLTRSLGFLFAVLATDQAYALYAQRDAKRVLPLAFLAAGAVLSHPGMALATALTILFFFVWFDRTGAGVLRTGLVAAVTAALTAPWWATVLVRHGITTFRIAVQNGWPPLAGLGALALLDVSGEKGFPVIAALALLGLALCLGRKRLFLPVWLALVFLLQSRDPFVPATLPLALLAGIGTGEVLIPLLAGEWHGSESNAVGGQAAPGPRWGERWRPLIVLLVLEFLIILAAVPLAGARVAGLRELSAGERTAMAWASGNVPLSGTFAVITGDRWFGADMSSEWFPVLAERASVATVQGYEWLSGFPERIQRNRDLQSCAFREADCLEAWLEDTGAHFAYVYIPKRCPVGRMCEGWEAGFLRLETSLRLDARYSVIYDGEGALILQRLDR